MATAQLLSVNPHPTIGEVREGLAGNLCRCTGFKRIFDSVAASAVGEMNATAKTGGAHAR